MNVFLRRSSANGVKAGLFFCLLLAARAGMAESLLLEFSDTASGQNTARVYGTATSRTLLTIRAVEGQQVVLRSQRGRDYSLEATAHSWSRFGTQVQQTPADALRFAVTPRLEADTVLLDVAYVDKQGDQLQSYEGTVQGLLGEWLTLFDHRQVTRGTDRRRISSTAAELLSVRVTRLPAER
ncbi:MAG: hypothetical protein AAGI24_10420 [Pseudomonadota bacterium]